MNNISAIIKEAITIAVHQSETRGIFGSFEDTVIKTVAHEYQLPPDLIRADLMNIALDKIFEDSNEVLFSKCSDGVLEFADADFVAEVEAAAAPDAVVTFSLYGACRHGR